MSNPSPEAVKKAEKVWREQNRTLIPQVTIIATALDEFREMGRREVICEVEKLVKELYPNQVS